MENYGFSEGKEFWKYKGGNEYQVLLGTKIGETVLNQIFEYCKDQIEYENPASKEYVLGWEILDDDELTEKQKMIAEYEGRIDPLQTICIESLV